MRGVFAVVQAVFKLIESKKKKNKRQAFALLIVCALPGFCGWLLIGGAYFLGYVAKWWAKIKPRIRK